MVNKENLTKQQVERLEEIQVETMDIYDCFNTEQQAHDQELHSEICNLGIEMVSLLNLYKEQLGAEGKLPLSHFRDEMHNLNVVVDSIQQAIIDLMPNGTVMKKEFYANDEEDE